MKCQFTNKESRVLKKRYEVFCYLLDEEDKDRDSVILLLRERMASKGEAQELCSRVHDGVYNPRPHCGVGGW
jgi:hypothetical protein